MIMPPGKNCRFPGKLCLREQKSGKKCSALIAATAINAEQNTLTLGNNCWWCQPNSLIWILKPC
jgi:hypothetical protein